MADDPHIWSAGGPLPIIKSHSLAKHRIFRAYLEKYVSVLTANLAQDQLRLTLIDGFSEGGLYRDELTGEQRNGSPLIMLEAMQSAAMFAQQARTKPFNLDVQFLFIEKNQRSLEHLESVIVNSAFNSLLGKTVHLINNEFVTELPTVIEFIRKRGRSQRAIFFLDQYGYLDVPLPEIRRLLESLNNAEVILTFATDWFIDYLNEGTESQRRVGALGIELPSDVIATLKNDVDWRRAIQFFLHAQIPEKTGARFYSPFFIRSKEAHRDLWLIHLSGHYRARDVMVELHWQENQSFAHYGRAGVRMLGYDPAIDGPWDAQKLRGCPWNS